MQIITEILSNFNTVTIILYGPTEIPTWHYLYGKKLYRHGTYSRSLLLSNRIKVTIVVFRFRELLPPGGKHKSITYSLLPFYITPLERHINSTIDEVIESFFFQHKSLFNISNQLNLSIPTINRWITKFHRNANNINKTIENKLIYSKAGYRPADRPTQNIFDTVKLIFKKVFILVSNKNTLLEYGIISWLNLNFQT